ncbi:unnamed protein product, partial [Ectocarpus sp. 12 AP-2014]
MDRFRRVHGEQLASAGIPERFHEKLHQKLENEVFDAGEKLFIALVEEGSSAAQDGSIGDSSETQANEGEGEEEGGKRAFRLKRKV